MGDTAERLAMPKRQDKPKIEGLQQEPLLKPPVGVPPNPLPVWVALPLDAKLPMIPGPKGSTVLYTTGLGEKIQVSSSEMDFDLTDPYSILMSNNYKPLHDPHLKSFLNAENMQQRLCRGGFITSDGKVICNLKEFNEYRQYLRKIILAMEKMKEQEEGGKPFPTKVKQDNEVIALMKQRGKKVKEVRERLAKQHEEDKRRYIRLKAEEDERRKKLREQFLEKLSTREKSMKERDERRMSLLKRSQMEERRKKLAMMQAWHDNDVKRRNQTEYRQRTRERERQQKLEQSWEERKRVQQRKIDEENEFREKEDANKKMRIEEREEGLRKQRQRLQGQLKELTEKRRIEKQRLEEIYLAQFKTKVEKQHANSLRARKRKSSKKPSKFRPRSVWDLEKTILEGLGGEGDNLKYARGSSEDIKRESLLRLMEDEGYSLDKKLQSSLNELALTDYKGANFNQEIVLDAADKSSSQIDAKSNEAVHGATDEDEVKVSVPGESHVTAQELYDAIKNSQRLKGEDYEDDSHLDDIEKAAKAIVDMTVFLTTKVIYPAYLRYLKEDYPDEYSKFIGEEPSSQPGVCPHIDILDLRDVTSCPSCKAEFGAMLPEWAPHQKKERRHSVRFSIVEQTIKADEFDHLDMLRAYQHDPQFYGDFGDSDAAYWADQEEDTEELSPVPESELALEAKDSLTVLNKSYLSPGDISEVLKGLISALQTGDLPSHQVQHVAHMAQELLLNARQSSSPIEKLLDNVPSDTSAMAEEIIMQTITDVQRTLFPEQMTEPGEAFDQITSIAELSQIIVTRAVDLAITNMLDIGTPRTKPRPGSAPAASPSPGLPSDSSTSSTSDFIGNVLERVVNELREEASRTLKKPSETSLFVRNVLSSAALDLRNSKSLDNYVDWDNAPLMKQSSASLTGQLVKDTLYRVAQEIDEEERKAEAVKRRSSTSLFADRLIEETIDNCVEDLKKYGLAHKAEKEFALKKSTSSTSDFVSDILDTVADELREDMNKTMRKQSETSEYVCDILSAAAEDLKNTKSLDNYVEWNDAPLMKYSSKSVTGQMVRDILFKVSKEIDEEEQKVADIESRKRSSTSLFAERLVMDTVQHCLADLQKDNMPKDELLKMASAILKSKASLQSKPAPKPLIHSVSDQGLSQPKIVDATSSTMIAALINETLTRVKLAMEKGSMSTSDVLKLAGGIDTSSLPTAALKTEESIHAEKLVADILQEAERRIPVKSASSMEGEQLVSDVIRTQIESTEVDEPGWVPDKDMQIELNENAKRSDTSVEADNLVSSIIDAVAQGASSLTKTVAPAQNIPPTTAESEEAEAAVKVAISEASLKIRQLSLPATLSQTAQMLVQEAIDNILENPDLITQLNTSVTDVAIHSSLSKVIKDSLSQVLINHNIQGSKMQIVNETEEEPAQPASTADEPASGILDHGFEHVIIKSEHVDDDSSDEETEVSVRPVIGHTPLHIDHHLVENALSILSVKKDVDIIEHHENLAARNSFADLMHPDIKGIARFNEESENSACKKFMTMSKHCIALPPAVEKQGVSKSADTAVVRETMTERKIRYSVDEDEQLMKVVNIHQAESLEDIHAQSCGGRKAPSVASVPHSYKPLETKTSEEKIVPKKPSKQSVHQISPKTSGTSVSKPSIVKSPYAQSMKGKGTPKASPSVSHATRPGAKPIGATSVPAVRSINQVTSVPKGSKSLSLSKESVKPASKQSSKGSDLHKKATSITNIEKSSDASQPITQDPTDIVDTPTSNLDPSCSKDSLKDAGGPPTDLTGETLAENENPDTFDEEAFASHFPGSLESGLPCSSSSDPDVSEASGQTSEVLGRDSPVAQTVDEEELPVRMKSIRKHGVSDIHVARVRDTSKQVRSASSTALMMHKKRLGSIDQGTPSDKQSVTRTSVAASSSKFFKAMSLSSRASKLAAAASKTGSMQSSHKMVNLTPRPSSGYSKSPTPASVANAAKSKQQIHIESKPEDDEPQEPKQGSYKDILKQRLDVSPKQSIMSLTELTVADSSSNQDLSKKLEEALSDTSCTHSESDYKQIKSIDEIMTPEAGEAEEKTSTSSLPKEDDMITHRISKHQHILLKQKHTDEDD